MTGSDNQPQRRKRLTGRVIGHAQTERDHRLYTILIIELEDGRKITHLPAPKHLQEIEDHFGSPDNLVGREISIVEHNTATSAAYTGSAGRAGSTTARQPPSTTFTDPKIAPPDPQHDHPYNPS